MVDGHWQRMASLALNHIDSVFSGVKMGGGPSPNLVGVGVQPLRQRAVGWKAEAFSVGLAATIRQV